MNLGIDLADRKVLVTGGAGIGVGGGVCAALDAAGAQLVINDIDAKAIEIAKQKYPDAFFVQADISQLDQVQQMFEQIISEVGVLDGLVNSAGIGLSKPVHQVKEGDFDRVMGVDLKAVWRLSKFFVNQCLEADQKGHIVNISSVHAHSTQAGYSIYASAKHAIVGLTRGMACDLGPLGMRVNAVAPGYVHADQNYDLIETWSDDPEQWVKDFLENQQVLAHAIDPIDIGHMVAFLLSDLARSITGQNIFVDNGTTSLIFNRDFT
ncbi:MAG: SDR family oxidoreductase [Saprospiraceae bacterium]|nr:SDR family oxidoreductase [Saprospiraceae bacterium]